MTLAGFGPIIYPPLMNWLLHLYGINGCMSIIGAIALHMLFAAVLLQPLKWHMVKSKTNIPPIQQTLSFPHIIPNVSTFLSIGKYSESSCKFQCISSLFFIIDFLYFYISVVPNSGPRLPFASTDTGFERKSSHFQLSHEIDTLSIYGFDQIIHRQPSNTRLDHAMIARNFSKRTLNTIQQTVELDVINRNGDASEPPLQIGKPLRWFESGSIGTINLGSSIEIFREPTEPSAAPRKASILAPWRRQSQHIVNALRIKSRRSSSQDMELKNGTKNDPPKPEEQNKMLDNGEYASNIEDDDAEIDGCCCNSIWKWLVQFFDLDLLRDSIFLNIMVGMAISIFAEINFAILTPFILSDLNFTSDEIAIILFAMAIADLISRFCSPFIADRMNLSIRVSYLISLVLLVATRTCKCFEG